jgi:putative transposase
MRCLSEQVAKVLIGLQIIVSDCCRFFGALFRSRSALAAENLFLRKQLALFREPEKKSRATTAADRFVLSNLARLFE